MFVLVTVGCRSTSRVVRTQLLQAETVSGDIHFPAVGVNWSWYVDHGVGRIECISRVSCEPVFTVQSVR